MGLLSGLEKFGFGKYNDIVDISRNTAGEQTQEKPAKKPAEEKKPPEETDFLMQKSYVCPVCDRKFKALAVRSTRLRRLDPDADLRPRCAYFDVIKYDTVVCPNCGYAAMGNYFEPLSQFQIKNLREQIMARFRPMEPVEKSTYTYEEAIERYQLCLMSAMVKNAKISEKAYICLKTAWLYNDLIAQLADDPKSAEKKAECTDMYEKFYRQAYGGFTQAMMKESPPVCGMNSTTLEYLLANMAMHFNENDVALRYVGSLITSKSASARVKDKARGMKDVLMERMKQ